MNEGKVHRLPSAKGLTPTQAYLVEKVKASGYLREILPHASASSGQEFPAVVIYIALPRKEEAGLLVVTGDRCKVSKALARQWSDQSDWRKRSYLEPTPTPNGTYAYVVAPGGAIRGYVPWKAIVDLRKEKR